MNRIVPLELMRQGEVGEVHDIDGLPESVLRLKEIGLREGVRIRMVSTGKPCIVAVGDHRLSYRGDDSAIVLIEVSSE
ncbi:MAG: FeoA family protein [Planctomycetota bacterium]|nr:FeoA family protein [Planctomycetota bacterium]MDA1212971.1 FeoA family protein [Planctomycetota bacterium]